MLRRSIFLAGLAIVGAVCLRAQSGAASGNVVGHVVCNDTQTPCRFATVTIETAPPTKSVAGSTDVPSHTYAASTDLNGDFEISGVAPGEYYILDRLAGYLSPFDLAQSEFKNDASLSAKAYDIALTRLLVNAGQTANVTLGLARGASLAGTIRFDDGGLAINTPVIVLRRDSAGKWQRYSNGSGVFGPLGLDLHTDDRGQYYESALPPGHYIVETTLPEVTALPATITGSQSLQIQVNTGNSLRVFSGDKLRLMEASVIDLKEGEDRSGVDIHFPTVGLHVVSGIVNPPTDQVDTLGGSVRLLDPEDASDLRQTDINQDGRFSFNYIPAGSYLLQIDAHGAVASGKQAVAYKTLSVPLLIEKDTTDLSYTMKSDRP